jgi:hypothetical protein
VFHTPAGQPIFDQKTADEWYVTGPSTLAVLQSIGVPAPGELRTERSMIAFLRSWITAGPAILRW